MQQELIEMLEEIIQYVEVWNAHDQSVLDKAEALIEKVKNRPTALEVGLTDIRIQELYEDCPSDGDGRFSLAEFARKVWDDAIALRAKENKS